MRDERGHRTVVRKRREIKNDSASFVCSRENASPPPTASSTTTTSLSVRSGASLLCLSPALASSPLFNTSASGAQSEGRKSNTTAHAGLSTETAEKMKLENEAEEHVQRQWRCETHAELVNVKCTFYIANDRRTPTDQPVS